MMMLLVGLLEMLGLLSGVLFALGVPLFFGLLTWDLIDQHRRGATERQSESVPEIAVARTIPSVSARRIPA
jgi:hypothetical protein